MNVGQVIEGSINNILKRKENLYIKRMLICKQCKLYKVDNIFGAMCNSSLYLNPITDELSKKEKIGYKQGCGCILGSKNRVPESHCPVDK